MSLCELVPFALQHVPFAPQLVECTCVLGLDARRDREPLRIVSRRRVRELAPLPAS